MRREENDWKDLEPSQKYQPIRRYNSNVSDKCQKLPHSATLKTHGQKTSIFEYGAQNPRYLSKSTADDSTTTCGTDNWGSKVVLKGASSPVKDHQNKTDARMAQAWRLSDTRNAPLPTYERRVSQTDCYDSKHKPHLSHLGVVNSSFSHQQRLVATQDHYEHNNQHRIYSCPGRSDLHQGVC